MNPIRRPVAILSILVALLLISAAAVVAQKRTSIVTRIKFARGRTTTIERGSVHRGMSHDYLLKASEGQTITVHLVARGDVKFDLMMPGARDSLTTDAKDYSGELPHSGDYRINVLPDTTTERSLAYTLEVTVR